MKQNEELLDIFKILGNAERLKIAGMLGMQPLSAAELVERLGLNREEVMSHLAHLQTAGFVREESNRYHLDSRVVEQVSRRVLAQSRPATNPALAGMKEEDSKILRGFVQPDGALRGFPTQRKKMLAVLRYVVRVFEPGARYSEKQVNEMLSRFHEDTASLRRYLVDEGMVQRESSIYWRSEELP
jgi:biotin operon repressor